MAQYVTQDGSWNWDLLDSLLSELVLDKLEAVGTPRGRNDKDTLFWGKSEKLEI